MRNKDRKEKYREFCKTEKKIPIFSKDWWLDAVCGENNWDVVIVEKDYKIVASLPYFTNRIFLFKYSKMPMFIPFLGPSIIYPQKQKYQNRISYENKVCMKLISELPITHYFVQHFNHNFTNWLAFFWNGYKQTTRYTYVIEDISDFESVKKNFSVGKRSDIKKAEKLVEVNYDLNSKTFYRHHKKMVNNNGEDIHYSYQLFEKLYNSAYKHKSGRTIYAFDKENNIHAAVFYVWDAENVYFLITAIDKQFRSSGASSLLVQEMIKDVNKVTKGLNFEGSMVQSYEKSYRQFGGTQTPYYRISKTNPKWLYNFLSMLNIIK